jgi:hypothetical protein
VNSFFPVVIDSLPFDVFGEPYSAFITDIFTNGIQAFDIHWTVPNVDRLHPLLGVLFEVRACIGNCLNAVSCPTACTTLRDTCENYGLGGDSVRSCSSACNPSELQLLPVMSSTSPTLFNQTITSTPHKSWSICDNGIPWPSSNLCSFNSLGTRFHIANGAPAMRVAGWLVATCTDLSSVGAEINSEVINLKPGVVYQFSAVAFNSHRVTRKTSPIFARPSIVDDSAPDAKFTMYSSVSVSPVIFQFYLTSQAPTLWRPRLGYIFDIVPFGFLFDGHSSLQSVFFWDQGCDGYQSTTPSILQTNQTTDATYYLDSQTGYAFSMFVMKNGMPLVNKTRMLNGMLYINYSVPYTGQQLNMSSDLRYTVRVYTVNALGVSRQPGYFAFSVSSIQPSILSTDGNTIVTMFGSGLGLPTYEANMRIKINGLECAALLSGSYTGEFIQFVAPRSYGLAPSWSFEMGVMSLMPMVIEGKSWFRYGAPQARWHGCCDCCLMFSRCSKFSPPCSLFRSLFESWSLVAFPSPAASLPFSYHTLPGRNFFKSERIVSARVTSGTGQQLCSCSIVVPIDDFSLYCTLESATEFKGFLRVTVFDQTSDVTPESSIITSQTKRGLEIERTLPFFRQCILQSKTNAPFRIVRNQCESCCNEACLSAHPKYLEKKFQVRVYLQPCKGIL